MLPRNVFFGRRIDLQALPSWIYVPWSNGPGNHRMCWWIILNSRLHQMFDLSTRLLLSIQEPSCDGEMPSRHLLFRSLTLLLRMPRALRVPSQRSAYKTKRWILQSCWHKCAIEMPCWLGMQACWSCKLVCASMRDGLLFSHWIICLHNMPNWILLSHIGS